MCGAEPGADRAYTVGVEKVTIKMLCEKYALGQTALARRFDIPLRTVQDWYSGRSNPPPYVITMLDRLLSMEQAEK